MELSRFINFDDYLSALKSKYRVRYRRAQSRMEGVSSRCIGEAEAARHRDFIHSLYRQTRSAADVNLVDLPPDYLLWLADVGQMRLYTRGQQPIGFTTLLTNGRGQQAHYLGIQEAAKADHHLYHNMLFDLVRDAIARGSEWLDLGRTASEIKSSIGAVGQDYVNMLYLRSALLRPLVPSFIPAFFQPEEWTPRNPYRDEGSSVREA
jgi:hypothetical protein